MSNDTLKQIQTEINESQKYVEKKREIIRERLDKYVEQEKDDDKVGVNTVYSMMQLGLAIKYADESNVLVMPRKFGDEEYADNLTDLAKFDFDEMERKQKKYALDFDAMFCGPSLEKYTGRDDVKSVATTEVMDPITWLPDPYGHYQRAFRYHYFEVEILKSDMTEEAGFDEELVSELTPQRLQELQTNSSYLDKARAVNSPMEDLNEDFYISCYDGYRYKDGDLYQVTVDQGVGQILREIKVDPVFKEEIKSGFIDMRTRVNVSWFSPIRDAFSISLLDLTVDKQKVQSILLNLRVTDAQFNTFGQMNLVNTDIVKNTADLTKPSINTKWIGVNAGEGSLSNAVYPVPRQSIMADSYNVSSELGRQLQLDTGFSDDSLGVPTKNITLGQAQQNQANANIRLQLGISVANWGEEAFWKFMWLRSYEEFFEASEVKFARVATGFDTIPVEFRRDDFIGSESPDIKIESKKVVEQRRQEQVAKFLTMLPYFMQNPEVPKIIKKQAMRYALRLQGTPREQIKLLTYDKDEEGAKRKLILLNNKDTKGARINSMSDDHQTYMVIFEQAIESPIKARAIQNRKDAYIRSGQATLQQQAGAEQGQGMINAMQSQMTSAAVSQDNNKQENIGNIAQNV